MAFGETGTALAGRFCAIGVRLLGVKNLVRSKAIWLMSLACALVASEALAGPRSIEPTQYVPRVGMYALKGEILSGGTCADSQTLPPFKYLYFVGRTVGSTLYYLNTPGMKADLVALPSYPKPGRPWKGRMTWTVNPLTFEPPSVTTQFSLSVTQIDDRLMFLNGQFHIPTSDGTCTEVVGYTGILISGID